MGLGRGCVPGRSAQLTGGASRLVPIQVGAASLSQAVASSATYPHEVLRSHMHVAGTVSPALTAVATRQVWPEVSATGWGCSRHVPAGTPLLLVPLVLIACSLPLACLV